MAKAPETQNEVIPAAQGEWTRTSVTLNTPLMERLAERLKEVNATREPRDRLTRDRFFELMLEWADRELVAQRKKGK